MGKGYSEKYEKEKMAVAVGKSLPVSTKHCIEICSFIRGKNLSKAKKLVGEVVELKRAVPFKRFNKNVGHRQGAMASGRYPQKAAKCVLALLNSVESNAQFKGLNTNSLEICHISAYNASRPWRFGRQSRRKAKRTNLEIMVIEVEKSKEENKEKKDHKKTEKSKENKN